MTASAFRNSLVGFSRPAPRRKQSRLARAIASSFDVNACGFATPGHRMSLRADRGICFWHEGDIQVRRSRVSFRPKSGRFCSGFAKARCPIMLSAQKLAERVGFEPTVRIDRTTAFEF
jgi:hypothetical protein